MKILIKTVFTFSLILIVFTSLSGCKKELSDQYNTITKKGYFVVGFDQTFAPMGYLDTDGTYKGFDIDLAKAVASQMGLDVKFQPIDWSMKENELNKGNIDVIWNGYTITDKRKQKVSFSDPYLENRQVIVVLSSSNITTKSDLQGAKVGVQTASSSYDALMTDTDLVNNFYGGQPYVYKTNDLAFNDLESKRIEAIVVDEILARYIIAQKHTSDFRILDDNFGTEEYGIGFRKNDVQFEEALNNAFNIIKENNQAAEISVKWFGENIII